MGTVKQYYFLVTNPEGQKKTILAVDANHAIQLAVEMDKFFWENWEYTCIKSKI